MEIVEEVNAAKETVSGEEAVWELLSKADKIVVTSGKKILEYVPTDEAKEEIIKKVSGRTGNLRAPALRIGDSYYIGFNESLYQQIAEM